MERGEVTREMDSGHSLRLAVGTAAEAAPGADEEHSAGLTAAITPELAAAITPGDGLASPRAGARHAHYAGESRRAVALPLGGLGAGHVSIAGDGSLRQWQLANTINHQGFVPDSFFALRVSGVEPPLDIRRTLRSRAIPPLEQRAPLVTDDVVPADDHPPTAVWPPVAATEMTVDYPFATIAVHDPDLQVAVEFDAWTPFVPLDAEASGLPVAAFTFRLANATQQHLHGWLVGALQNAVGWDGVTPIEGNRCPLYGGNENRLLNLGPDGDQSAILMTNPSLQADDPRAGEMLLAVDRPAVAIARAASARGVLRFAEALKLLGPTILDDWSPDALVSPTRQRVPFREPQGPSPAGTTWDGALAVPFALAPGDATTIEFLHAWWFPNRVADFDQFGPELPIPETPSHMGNRYATRFDGAIAVARSFGADRPRLLASSRAWAESVAAMDAPPSVAATVAAQPALVRSPTTFLDREGRLLGFEGGLGASTLNWNGDVGGSCPLNCSHVWNYEQAIAALFPDLERTMRDVEWDILQAPDGSIPHRLRVPLDGPQLHRQPVGGPLDPALDGMLGSILKTYREARLGGGREMLERRWPAMVRVATHVAEGWDPAGDGVLRGAQPVTYDIALTEPNAYVGSLWIAALRALGRVATILGRNPEAARYAADADRASRAYDDLLWNGRYYGRAFPEDTSGLGSGCLADQLNGQWWAHQLELGHVLPRDHVRTALRTIVAVNLRRGFRDFHHGFRVLADGDDTGLLLCTWPDGDRPLRPVRYADEVWTGIEYAVASLCLFEGLGPEALAILDGVRGRYDGTRRNPYNEIECGDHYSRGMAGWSVLQGSTGASADVIEGVIRLGRPGRAPLLLGTAWGRYVVEPARARIDVLGGSFRLAAIELRDAAVARPTAVAVRVNGAAVPANRDAIEGGTRVTLVAPIDLDVGSVLEVEA